MMTTDSHKKSMADHLQKLAAVLIALIAVLAAWSASAYAADNGIPEGYEPPIYNSIPAMQFKDVFETETLKINDLRARKDGVSYLNEDQVTIRIFNSTTQETEAIVQTDWEGYLPELELKKNHNYILFVEDPRYMLGTKRYIQILKGDAPAASDGDGAYDYKTDDQSLVYNRLTQFNVYKRDQIEEDPFDDNRFTQSDRNAIQVPILYKGELVKGKTFRLVSELETITATSPNGYLNARLIEDITYMVYLDDDTYTVDPFPLVAKDKSEYGEGRYLYDHTDCFRIEKIELIDKADAHKNDTTVTSLKGNTRVSGMNFRHLLILDRSLDADLVNGLPDGTYDVIGITAVNPHRWEISKLVGTDFTITQKVPEDKTVKNVYQLSDGQLVPLNILKQDKGSVTFVMDSLSIDPVVIEYQKEQKPADSPIYRLYNPKTKEHLYTPARKEYNVLPQYGWKQEGIGWYAPMNGKGVYRLYNTKTGDHHYTADSNEAKVLTTKFGWTYDNNGKALFNTGGSVDVYRLYNKKLTRGSHHFTTSAKEYSVLPQYGWKQEGAALKAMRVK